METSFNYLFWLTFFVWIPSTILLVIFPWVRKYTKTFVLCALGALIFSLPWDFWAIYTQIWYFPEENIIGMYVDRLPVEEIFFIVFVTLLISLVTLVLKKYMYQK